MNPGKEVKKDATQAAVAADVAMPTASEPVTPVRSAKDAINAMYAQDAQNRLSNYLASSAKEIINAGKTSNQKSAANLHHGSNRRQVETVRPSASGLLKTARVKEVIIPNNVDSAMDPLARRTAPTTPKRIVRAASATPPVVKTSLKLGPKKAPTTIQPQNIQQNRLQRNTALRAQKGSTALAEMLANRQQAASTTVKRTATATSMQGVRPATRTQTAGDSIRAIQQAARKTTASVVAKKAPVARPKMPAPRGLMQDIVRPTAQNDAVSDRVHVAAPSVASETAASAKKTIRHPFDSVKRRFRPAPKNYTATSSTQTDSYTGYDFETQDNVQDNFDNFDAFDAQPPIKPPVEIYGLMDEEPTGKRSDGLGVVEDYRPRGGLAEQKVAQGSGKAAQGNGKTMPDNNRYALGGQSPFFLKSVNVEKRPLSDVPSKKRKDTAGTLYEKPGKDAVGRKNIYDAKPDKKTLPTKPTVIIPASRRSKVPLVCLLLLTVILGAAVGGFVYLCFFQEM